MTLTWPPQNPAEMRALQKKYGGDADIAAALGIARKTVVRCRQGYNLPTVTKEPWRPVKAGKNIDEKAIAEMFAGRKFR